ncbi:hypothetical protein C357_16211 [Citreicella sp. 357]|nr:hypothetical protein C357_16211 [Citreicella sp. 357]
MFRRQHRLRFVGLHDDGPVVWEAGDVMLASWP